MPKPTPARVFDTTAHVFDHDGTYRHHHHFETGLPEWWLNVEQFGGQRREHRHTPEPTPDAVAALAEALHSTPWESGQPEYGLGDLTHAHGSPTDYSWTGPAKAILEHLPEGWSLTTTPDPDARYLALAERFEAWRDASSMATSQLAYAKCAKALRALLASTPTEGER